MDRDTSPLRCLVLHTDRSDGDPRVVAVVGRHGAGHAEGPGADARFTHPEDLQIRDDGSESATDRDGRHLVEPRHG